MTSGPQDFEPLLAVPSQVFPKSFGGHGFLTPTPLLLSDGIVRVYGGVRDGSGVARIGWADINVDDRKLVDVCELPVIDLGIPGTFDSNGMILGDFCFDDATQSLVMAYVGFSKYPSIKFRAYSGFAVSTNNGLSFERCDILPAIGTDNFDFSPSIIAIHDLVCESGLWKCLVAVGDGWEMLNGTAYPRYSTWEATGPDLLNLSLSDGPILNPPEELGLYRLGRPRRENRNGKEAIVATGMTRDGVYRPYVFESVGGSWVHKEIDSHEIRPGCSPYALKQSSYPAVIELLNGEKWTFFNGDDMGRAGALLLISRGLGREDL